MCVNLAMFHSSFLKPEDEAFEQCGRFSHIHVQCTAYAHFTFLQ
jgi:hypothetical protein